MIASKLGWIDKAHCTTTINIESEVDEDSSSSNITQISDDKANEDALAMHTITKEVKTHGTTPKVHQMEMQYKL